MPPTMLGEARLWLKVNLMLIFPFHWNWKECLQHQTILVSPLSFWWDYLCS